MPVLRRLWFVLLSTAVMVFFSEKAFWFPQGYPIVELLLFYAAPIYCVMWGIEQFRVSQLPTVVLVAALYAFLVEGVLTPVMFESGPLDPIMPSYFVGWHGLLSVVFGWYWVRRWLVNGRLSRLLLSSTLFGLLWGAWSITYWLPETFVDFHNPGRWPTWEYGLHALTFTLLLMAGHWLLGRGGWMKSFKLGKWEKGFLIAWMLFLFGTLSALNVPFAAVMLPLWLLLVLLPLRLSGRHRGPDAPTVLTELAGPVRQPWHLFALLLMPVTAVSIYGTAALFQPNPETLRPLLELLPIGVTLAGGGMLVWSVLTTVRRMRNGRLTAASPHSTVE